MSINAPDYSGYQFSHWTYDKPSGTYDPNKGTKPTATTATSTSKYFSISLNIEGTITATAHYTRVPTYQVTVSRGTGISSVSGGGSY
jgi:hypothetical protein